MQRDRQRKEIYKNSQTDRQTDIQTYRETDRYTDLQTYRETDRKTRPKDGQTDRRQPDR